MSDSPDLIITNADIITMDPEQPRAEAVAVKDGLIVAVGDADDITDAAGADTQVIDLGGGVLTPGFVEPHSHVLLMAMLLAPQIIDIRSFVTPTWEDIKAKVTEAIAQTPAGTPVVAFGIDSVAHNLTLPTRADLDELTTDHPLALITLSAHTVSVNSAGFEYAGVSDDTADPTGGRFQHDDNGSLTGIVEEAPAVGMVLRPMMGGIGFDPVASLRYQGANLARAGFTTIGELLVQEADLPMINLIKSMPDFPVRMRIYEATNPALTAFSKPGDTNSRVRETGFKLWVDGSPLEGKSFQKEPFLDTPVTRKLGLVAPCCGSANYSEEELLTAARTYGPIGMQMASHVQGDAGIDRILDVYETVLNELDLIGTDHRWRLEHCGGMTAEQFERANSLGVTCSMFVRHVYYFGDSYVDDILGEPRGSHWMPLKTAVDSGMTISLHNDGYFTPPGAIPNMETATTRASKSGRILGPEERIGIDDALKAVTINAAWHLFSEDEVGSIEVGKCADFAQLSADPYTVEPAELEEKVAVLGTWIGGQKVDLASLEGTP